MTLKQTHVTERILNLKTKEAITLANESRWDEAVFVNRFLVESVPYDIGAYNRLGKALSELGRYSEARDSFQNALSISPYNSIAKKNLLRLANLKDESKKKQRSILREPQKLYSNFVTDSSKSLITKLLNLPSRKILAKIGAGDIVNLELNNKRILVRHIDGEYLGELETKISLRIARLIAGGNQYEATLTGIRNDRITVMIRETFKHPSQIGMVSFPFNFRETYKSQDENEISKDELDTVQDEDGIEIYESIIRDSDPITEWINDDEELDDESSLVAANGFHEETPDDKHNISFSDEITES